MKSDVVIFVVELRACQLVLDSSNNKPNVSSDLTITSASLTTFYKLFDCPYIQRLLAVDCCNLVSDKYSISCVLLYNAF